MILKLGEIPFFSTTYLFILIVTHYIVFSIYYLYDIYWIWNFFQFSHRGHLFSVLYNYTFLIFLPRCFIFSFTPMLNLVIILFYQNKCVLSRMFTISSLPFFMSIHSQKFLVFIRSLFVFFTFFINFMLLIIFLNPIYFSSFLFLSFFHSLIFYLVHCFSILIIFSLELSYILRSFIIFAFLHIFIPSYLFTSILE